MAHLKGSVPRKRPVRRTRRFDPIVTPDPNPVNPPCNCLEFCANLPSGTMAYCEDGVWTAIPPPTVNSVLKFNAATGIPYWEPENLLLVKSKKRAATRQRKRKSLKKAA